MVNTMKRHNAVSWIIAKRWLLLFIFIILLLFIYLPQGIDRALANMNQEKTVWALPEDAVCLYPERNMDIRGYEINGNRFTPVDSDPQLGFSVQDETIQYLLIDLEKPVEQGVRVEIYYDEKTGNLSEDKKIEGLINENENQMMVSLPSMSHDYIRIDINGEVQLNGIYYSNAGFIESIGTVSPSSKTIVLIYGVCVLFFIAILFSIGMAVFSRNGAVSKAPFIITAIARVWLGITAGVWYPQGQYYDDGLIFHYSNLSSYLSNLELANRDVMLKELGMPIILNIVNGLGISYTMFLSLLWVLDGVLAAVFVKKINRGRRSKSEFLAFLFVLFQPIALEKWTGTRLYRNPLLTPMYFMVFLIGLIMLYNLIDGSDTKIKQSLMWSLLLGVVFSLAYYIKEDGVWLLLSLCALFLIIICVAIYKMSKRQLTRANRIRIYSFIVIPFMILFGTTALIKQINYNAFGVYATNARTAGEEGKFVTYVYKTASDDRSLDVWAPADAIDQVFKASPTLKNNKALKKAVFKTPWYAGNIKKNPIQGDFLTWVLKDALFDSGTCASKMEAEQYMKQVNQELEQAFRSGTLQVDPKLRLTSSMGGVSKHEILQLLKDTLTGYKDMLNTGIYEPGAIIQFNNENDTQFASIMANQDLNTVSSDVAVKYRKYEITIADGIIATVFQVYNYIQPLMFALGIIGCIIALWFIVKSIITRVMNIHQLTKTLLVLFFLALSFAYLFAISWFTHFLYNEYFSFFYSIGALPIITLFELTGCSVLCDVVHPSGFSAYTQTT